MSLRLLDTHGWDVAFDSMVEFRFSAIIMKNGWQTVGIDVTSWSESFTVDRDESSNFTTPIGIEVGPPSDAEQGDRVGFVVEALWPDVDGILQTSEARFGAVVGWIDVLEVPEDSMIGQGTVTSFDVSFKNLVTAPLEGTTTFQFSLSMGGGLDHTLTDRSVEDLTAQEVASTPAMTHLEMENNGTAELRIWVISQEWVDGPVELEVLLAVHVPDQPASRTGITFQLTVFDPVHDIVLVSNEADWYFRKGEEKEVTFLITSRGNLDTTIEFTYTVNQTDAFRPMQPLVEEMVLSHSEVRTLAVIVLAMLGSFLFISV